MGALKPPKNILLLPPEISEAVFRRESVKVLSRLFEPTLMPDDYYYDKSRMENPISLLQWAILHYSSEMVKHLLTIGADPNFVPHGNSANIWRPIFIAISENVDELYDKLELLVRSGADINEVEKISGDSVLHFLTRHLGCEPDKLLKILSMFLDSGRLAPAGPNRAGKFPADLLNLELDLKSIDLLKSYEVQSETLICEPSPS